MASELPPTYYFSDITFNPTFYSSSSDNITNEEAKKLILSYTTSGTDTITTLNTATINSLGSTLSIGTNGTTMDTVIIGTNSNTQTKINGGSIGLLNNTAVTGTLTSTGLITANNGITVPLGKAMTASGTLVASIGTISGNTSIVTLSGQTPSLVGGSYNINLFVICTGGAAKTITLMDPIANQNIIFRARQSGGSSVTIQANNLASIIYPLGIASPSSQTSFTITGSISIFSDGINWYVY